MDEFLRSHPWVAWVGAGLAFVVFIILLLHMIKILFELRRRLPGGERSRQLRLGFVENFDLDGERQLLLVRRDNVEHLLMIGGPNDVLVESGIVRAEGRASRGAFEPATAAAAASAPSGLVLPPVAAQDLPSPVRPEPAERAEASAPVRPEMRFEPKSEPKFEPAPRPEPPSEIDIEQELKAALEASPLLPNEPPSAPVAPPPTPLPSFTPPPPPSFAPPPERPATRFTPPPRPSFRAPLPPRSPGAPSGASGGEAPTRPRFV
ncbi:hypothetical protein CKO16_03085, partial [Rhodoblastus acidophilus]